MITALGLLEYQPVDALIVAILFTLVSLIAYVPFLGFSLYLKVSHELVEWFGYSSFTVATAYWLTTLWALIVCVASTVLVVLRIAHRR
jgi:uncharacterized membrane protein (GlpM family)